jgi:multicomponent Na+:H+ antiporter subunit C
MEVFLAVASGVMFAASFYLMLRRNLLRFIIGLIIMGNAVNLLIFTMGRLTRGEPPVIPKGMETMPAGVPYANPLPQALILTAIVISFGLLAFTLVLVYRNYASSHSLQADDLNAAEPMRPLDADTDARRLPA